MKGRHQTGVPYSIPHQVCENRNGITIVHHSDKTKVEADRICQNMIHEHASKIPVYFVRIQRRKK